MLSILIIKLKKKSSTIYKIKFETLIEPIFMKILDRKLLFHSCFYTYDLPITKIQGKIKPNFKHT